MSPERLRKRLERLEYVLRAQTDAAALANRPQPQPQDRDEDLEHFQLMHYRARGLSKLTTEERAHFERLSALHPDIANVQASWVKLGPEGTTQALAAGVNDLGGTLMNESISRSAGAAFGQELPPEWMEELIRSAGRVPRQRTTLYEEPAAARVRASFDAPPLSEPLNPAVKDAGLVAPPRLVRPGLLARTG